MASTQGAPICFLHLKKHRQFLKSHPCLTENLQNVQIRKNHSIPKTAPLPLPQSLPPGLPWPHPVLTTLPTTSSGCSPSFSSPKRIEEACFCFVFVIFFKQLKPRRMLRPVTSQSTVRGPPGPPGPFRGLTRSALASQHWASTGFERAMTRFALFRVPPLTGKQWGFPASS